MRKSLLVVLAVTILSAACSGQASSPASPSGLAASSTPSTTGATVNGSVRLGATAPILGSAADPMKVEVVGTNIVSVVSAAGQFELTNVPVGQIKLHFFGAGTDASVTISQVQTGETVTISVTVVGTSAGIDSELHSSAGEEELEGRIESLPPTQPAGTLVVAGRTVKTDGSTIIKQGGVTRAFADLAIGQRVHVKGRPDATALLASLIEIQNTNTAVSVEINGIVENLTGSELAFQFYVNGRLIKGDTQTEFFGNDHLNTFADLSNQDRVEVKGEQRDGYVYAVRIHINEGNGDADDDDDDDDDDVELKGAVSGTTGTCPTVTFTLQGKTVVTSSSTTYKNLTCADLKTVTGMMVEVEGTMSGTQVLATKISREDDPTTEVQLSGVVSGASGTCPVVTFTLQGKTVVTSSSTTYKNLTCSDLITKTGLRVEVEGLQSGSSVQAKKIGKD